MERIKTGFVAALVLLILTFSLILRFPGLAFGGEPNSEPCWPTDKTYRQNLSANPEIWRNYSLPPAWGNFDPKQEESPISKDLRLAVRTDNYRALN